MHFMTIIVLKLQKKKVYTQTELYILIVNQFFPNEKRTKNCSFIFFRKQNRKMFSFENVDQKRFLGGFLKVLLKIRAFLLIDCGLPSF